MDDNDLLRQIDRLIAAAETTHNARENIIGVRAQISEFLRTFAGPNSSFYAETQRKITSYDVLATSLVAVLKNYSDYIKAGLRNAISPARQVQLDVVSDFLDQARILIESKGVHPAAPIVLIGATLEEFLRTWVESAGLALGQRKPSLDAYAHALLAAGKINKQDLKDITSWAGLRNHAAHGEWAEVDDRQRASLMLEGVNLFMRNRGC